MSATEKSPLQYPFLRPEFLNALENSKSACTQTGWEPIHLSLATDTGTDNALMPLYLKDHSMGEYVFDYAWANAYQENGLDYYPKLLTAIPFTPSIGPRVRSTEPLEHYLMTQDYFNVPGCNTSGITMTTKVSTTTWQP